MPRTKPLQTNFSSGELAPGLAMRRDTQQFRDGAKSLLNRRCLIEGGTCRRPGSWRGNQLTARGRAIEFIVNATTQYVVLFGDGRMDAYVRNVTTGALTAAGSLTGCPWTAAIFQEMDYVQSANTAFLTHESMAPQAIVRTGDSTWTRAALTYYSDNQNRIHTPFYKLADQAVTMQPSALTGSVTLTIVGANVFDAAHIGLRFRYLGKQLQITAVAGPTSATATVIDGLPPSQTLALAAAGGFSAGGVTKHYINATGFFLGDAVTGSVTGAKGEVTARDTGANTITVAITSGLDKFAFGTGGDDVLGPNGRGRLTAVGDATPQPVRDWDEQLFSAYRGYPAAVVLHRNRLLFAGHPLVPNALIGSRPTNLYDFDVGDGNDGDGIFVTIGDAASAQIVQLHSAEQLLVLTDAGPYYVPETVANPFRPSSIEFFPFGNGWPISRLVRARAFDDGVLMVSGSLVLKATPTGDAQRMWDAEEVSLLASHLIKTPINLAVCSNFNGGPERYAVFVNTDGTAAAMMMVEKQKLRNFTPWETTGSYHSMVSIGGDIYATVQRTLRDATVYLLEQFDQGITLDAATSYADEAALTGITARYGNNAANVVVTGTNYHLGTYPLSLDEPPAGPYAAGLFYESEIETMPPEIEGREGSRAGDQMRILRVDVFCRDSARFAAQGLELQAYQWSDSLDQPPPSKQGPQRFEILSDWQPEPTVRITQPDPLPLTIDAIRAEVAV